MWLTKTQHKTIPLVSFACTLLLSSTRVWPVVIHRRTVISARRALNAYGSQQAATAFCLATTGAWKQWHPLLWRCCADSSLFPGVLSQLIQLQTASSVYCRRQSEWHSLHLARSEQVLRLLRPASGQRALAAAVAMTVDIAVQVSTGDRAKHRHIALSLCESIVLCHGSAA